MRRGGGQRRQGHSLPKSSKVRLPRKRRVQVKNGRIVTLSWIPAGAMRRRGGMIKE